MTDIEPDDSVHQYLVRWSDFAPNALAECEAVIDGAPESLIVHRDADGGVRAWLNICPHAGRRLDWAPGQFLVGKDGRLVCAAHGAAFELANGECVAGPCRGASLRAVEVVRDEAGVRLASM